MKESGWSVEGGARERREVVGCWGESHVVSPFKLSTPVLYF